MALPTYTVGVALGVPDDDDFIIGDATRGVIGSSDYLIASGRTVVTGDVFDISVTRGRFSRLWDAVDAGTCRISLRNNDRAYDPSYLLSPFSGYITPGRSVNIKANDLDIWTGFVDDWDLDYDVEGLSSASLMSTDVLGQLGQMEFDAWTSTATTAGSKLSMVCERSEVAWPAALRDFDDGVEALQSDSVSWGSSVLNYGQLIARSELGYLFASTDGTLTYRDRNVAVGASSFASFSDATGTFEAPVWDASGDVILDEFGEIVTTSVDVIPFTGIAATVGSELLFARVGVDREGGTNQTATVADFTIWSETNGPIRSLSIPSTLLADDAQSLALAEYLLTLYDTARYRVSEITIDVTSLSAAQQSAVLGLDITDVIDVTFTPNGVGASIMQNLVVQGIRHSIGTERHTMSFSTIEAPFPYFRIGDATYGVIGDDIIGF